MREDERSAKAGHEMPGKGRFSVAPALQPCLSWHTQTWTHECGSLGGSLLVMVDNTQLTKDRRTAGLPRLHPGSVFHHYNTFLKKAFVTVMNRKPHGHPWAYNGEVPKGPSEAEATVRSKVPKSYRKHSIASPISVILTGPTGLWLGKISFTTSTLEGWADYLLPIINYSKTKTQQHYKVKEKSQVMPSPVGPVWTSSKWTGM